MYHEMNVREPKDPLERIKQKALQVIATHGALRWCSGGICACMGCANHTMTREEYDLAITMPEVQAQLSAVAKPKRGWFGTLDFDTSKISDRVEMPDFLQK